MSIFSKIASQISLAIDPKPLIEGSDTELVLNHLSQANPSHAFKQAKKIRRCEKEFRRIDRNGIFYYASRSYGLLNPFHSQGVGLQFVKGDDSDPTGVFFTDGATATDKEVWDAISSYLFAFGVPRKPLIVAPASLWKNAIEHTPENILNLKSIGSPLGHLPVESSEKRAMED